MCARALLPLQRLLAHLPPPCGSFLLSPRCFVMGPPFLLACPPALVPVEVLGPLCAAVGVDSVPAQATPSLIRGWVVSPASCKLEAHKQR